MKRTLLPVAVLLSANVFAQNVGVGVPSPQERLDVSGRLRLSTNNTAGAPTGGAGTIRWNGTAGFFQGWDGSQWVSFGSPAGLLSQTLPSGQVFVGNVSNIATGVALSGDATITNAGVLTIGAGAVTTGKILNGTIVDEDINASAAIARTKLASGTANALVVNNASGVMTGLAPGTSGQFLQVGAGGAPEWVTPGGTFIQNQNSAVQPTSNFWVSGRGIFGNGTVGAPSVSFDGSQTTGLFRPAADALAVSTAGAERLRVSSGGNVGINVTGDASERFQIGGNMLFNRGGARRIYLESANANSTGDSLRISSGSAASSGGARSGGSLLLEAGNAYTHTDNTVQGGNVVLRSGGNRFTNPSFASQWGDIVFESARNVTSSSNSTPVERMRIDGPSGNVGINVTAPTQRLDIDGQVRIRGGAPGAGKVLTSDANGVGTWTDPTGIVTAENGLTETAPATIRLGGALTQATTVSGLTATNKMSFTGTGVDAFNVDGTTLSVDATNDRVGVGTNSPAAKLDVSGGNIALNDNQIRFRAGNDGNHYVAHLGGSFDGPILHGNQTVYMSTGQNSEGVRVLGSAAGGTQLVVDASYDLGTMPPSESTLILGSRGGVEGAQIQMNNANSAGTAWFIDVETNDLRFLTGNNATGSSALAVKLESNGRLEAEEFNTRSGNLRSAQRANFYLSLQSDRNMVLYDGGAIWSSGTAVSDIRTKRNIRPLENVLPILERLSAIRFQYKDELNLGSEDHIGVIAQEILEYFPDMVYHDKESDRYIVHYEKLTTVLLRGLQEQQTMIRSMMDENTTLKASVSEHSVQMTQLQSEMEMFKNLIQVGSTAGK